MKVCEQKFPVVREFQGTATLDIQLLNILLLILMNKQWCCIWVWQYFQTTGHDRVLTSPFFEFSVCYVAALYSCKQQSHSFWSNDDM